MMTDAQEKYGPNSRCVMWGNVPKCNEVSCSGNVVTVKVSVNGVMTNFACTGDGAVINAAGSSFTCPASQADFCALMDASKRCPNDCSGKGFCMGVNTARKCVCMYGWEGTDCSTQGVDNIGVGDQKNSSSTSHGLIGSVTWVLLGFIGLLFLNW